MNLCVPIPTPFPPGFTRPQQVALLTRFYSITYVCGHHPRIRIHQSSTALPCVDNVELTLKYASIWCGVLWTCLFVCWIPNDEAENEGRWFNENELSLLLLVCKQRFEKCYLSCKFLILTTSAFLLPVTFMRKKTNKLVWEFWLTPNKPTAKDEVKLYFR